MAQLSDAKRDAILEAAARVFLAQGYSAVTMDALAEAVPVSKPTLYNYFPGKPALFAAVVTSVCKRMAAAIELAARDNGDLRHDLELIARAFVDNAYAPESIALYRVLIAEVKHFPELGKLTYESGVIPMLNDVSAYLRSVGKGADVRFPRAEESARLLISMLSGDEFHRCLLDLMPTLSARERGALVRRVVDQFLRAHRADD
jgi:TetR/AcrR family transcriptional repressor of mexJK operon